jgi:hypothetical protein
MALVLQLPVLTPPVAPLEPRDADGARIIPKAMFKDIR